MQYVHTLVGSLLLLSGCGNTLSKSRPSPLDYAEIAANDGWYLRIHGDGSGSLTHRQHPRHHLDYPIGTFDLAPIAKLSRRCRTTDTVSPCHGLSYYRATVDAIRHCDCIEDASVNAAMTTAIAKMQLAVDDERSERSCRMLRRAWFVGADLR